ncbi:MAG: hypothetical protein M9913_23935 [Bryobacteraceae bacterium]|nr:hypothetical protein [Bryobacteraceae bacterium]
MDAGAGEQGRDGDLAVGDVGVEFVAAPMIVVTPAVSFGADVALGGRLASMVSSFWRRWRWMRVPRSAALALGKGPFLRLVLPALFVLSFFVQKGGFGDAFAGFDGGDRERCV